MSVLVLGLLLFIGAHLVPAVPALRASLVARWGEDGYKKRFSLASLAGFVLIIVGYGNATQRELLFAPVPAAIRAAPLVVSVALVLFAAANMRAHIRRILKHPMLIGLLLWSLTHLLANGEVRATVLFGSLFAYAVVDLASAISRGAVKTFQPSLKFDAMAVVGGLLVAALVMHFHAALFGVPAVMRAG